MEQSEVIAERDTAGVLARVIVCVLAMWCLPFAVVTSLYGVANVDPPSFAPNWGLGIPPGATILLPLALAVALFTRGYRVVQWAAGRALRRESCQAPGSGWLAVGLPLLAICFLTRALNNIALSLQWVLAIDEWQHLRADLVSIALAVSILLAAPALTRAWSRWNTPRAL